MLKFVRMQSTLIDESTKKVFMKNVQHLEKSISVDYHPGTNDQVIDLVHPSMFCYVKGMTQTSIDVNDNILFQWLPSEFCIEKEETKILSYINNLDYSTNSDLYTSIGTIFNKFVPEFDTVFEILYKNQRLTKQIKLHECQVIVKLANTVLTPENPKFPGGNWHLEGLPYEKIVATGIYYYEMTNITQNFLYYRSTLTSSDDVDYQQNCWRYVKIHYGFDDINSWLNNQSTIIDLGCVETKENMCIIFPNFMQHRVSEFSLVDKTKPGEDFSILSN